MNSAITFALCVSSLTLSVASHRSGHTHEMPHLHQQYIADNFIDVTTDSEFFGLATFANVPYVNCLKTDGTDGGRYDIAILGAPFDTVSRLSFEVTSVALMRLCRASLVDPVQGSVLRESAEALSG